MDWKSQPKQYDFLTAKEYCVLYGGARGGGKTDGELAYLISVCIEYPGAQTMLLRKSFQELAKPKAAIPRSHDFLHGTAAWNEQHHTWKFPNGSLLQFGHLSDRTAINDYLGTQVDVMVIDQAEEITYDEFNRLKGSVRSMGVRHCETGELLKPHIRLTANPGGIGQAWLKALFIDAAPANTTYWVDSRGDDPVISLKPMPHAQTYRFIPAKVWDNQELLKVNPDYVDQLYGVGGVLARAWVTGDWGGFAGQFFEEFRRDIHVVKPFKIPANWPKWHATDWGYAKPSCTLWLARASYSAKSSSGILIPKGTVIVYRERYQIKQGIPDQCLTIRTWSGNEQFRNQLLDPSCWGQYDANGLTFAENYARNGVAMAKAFNGRKEGWARMREMLKWCNDAEFKPCKNCLAHQIEFADKSDHISTCEACQNGEISNGCIHNTFMPNLLIQSHCVNLIRTLPNLVHDQKDPEDVDTRGEDHAPDALRYGITASDVQADMPEHDHQTAIFGARK